MDKKPFPELGLAPEILKAVTELGFELPSPIQAQAIPPALEGRDVVGQSQTGSGKTMAFAIPAVQLVEPHERGVRVLIMCPTRELAMQVCDEVHKLTAHKHGVKAIPIYGGATYDRQIRGLRDGAQIVVGTPGRILDFVEKGMLKLDGLKMLVFDEADEMLDMGFRDEIDKLMTSVPQSRQTLFFSATLAGPIRHLVDSYTRNAALITVEHKALTVPTIEQRYYEVNSRSKMEVLCRILDMENPRLAIDHRLIHSGDPRRHHRFARLHRLEDDVRHPLEIGRKRQQVDPLDQRRRRADVPEETDVFRNFQIAGPLLER